MIQRLRASRTVLLVGWLGASCGGKALDTPVAAHGGDAGSDGDDASCGLFGCPDAGVDPCMAMGLPSTTIHGAVYDPAGRNPLYNVIVSVPSAPLDPFRSGPSCTHCPVVVSGQPIVSAVTDTEGTFTLSNVPPGDDVPLVMQVGKWRRQITIPHVPACAETLATGPSVMRLPATQSEGDMPQFAVATGGCDRFECLLRKIGIADSEFTDATASGKVHLFQGAGGAAISPSTTNAQTFWSDAGRLLKYDTVINACECAEHAEEKPQAAVDNLVGYANGGGQLINTHLQYFWLDPGIAAPGESSPWTVSGDYAADPPTHGGVEIATVRTDFPEGSAFAHWLIAVGASARFGLLPIAQARSNVNRVNPPTLDLIDGLSETGTPTVLAMRFRTPRNAPSDEQCGRVTYADFQEAPELHGPFLQPGATFPTECDGGPMTPQEKALEFMIFDLLATCIEN